MKRKIKHSLCIIFGHKDSLITDNRKDGGCCKRCGWGMFSNEYLTIEKLHNY